MINFERGLHLDSKLTSPVIFTSPSQGQWRGLSRAFQGRDQKLQRERNIECRATDATCRDLVNEPKRNGEVMEGTSTVTFLGANGKEMPVECPKVYPKIALNLWFRILRQGPLYEHLVVLTILRASTWIFNLHFGILLEAFEKIWSQELDLQTIFLELNCKV